MKLYGIAEVADAAGVKRATVSAWCARGKMPEPSARLLMGPVWTARRIEPWIEEIRAHGPIDARTARKSRANEP